MAALQAYRALLRQIRTTFKSDEYAIRVCSREARSHFEANKGLNDVGKIQEAIANAEDARLCIQDNIVQAQKTSCGTYAVRAEDAPRLKMMSPDITPPAPRE